MLVNDKLQFAFDKKSARAVDENGYMRVAVSHISKECVNPYLGREIPGWKETGLNPDQIYNGYRSGQALAQGASTFNGLPLLRDHHEESAYNPQKEYRVGSLGTDAKFNAPYLDNSLIVTDYQAIKEIEEGLYKELSSSYRYDPVFEPGEFQGDQYDFVMTNIRGNHVALVEEGRAGPDVVVADGKLVGIGETMKERISQKLKKVFRANDANPAIERAEVEIGKTLLDIQEIEAREEGMSKEEIGLDEDKNAGIKRFISKYFGDSDEDTLKKIADELADLAYSQATGDEDISEDEDDEDKAKDEDKVEDSDEEKTDDEELKKAMDKCGIDSESPEFQKAFAEGVKYGEGKELDDRKKMDREHESEGMKKAMDSYVFKKLKNLNRAAADARCVLGDINPMAFDSASEIYKAALNAVGVHIKGKKASAYRDMFMVYKELNQPKQTYGYASSAVANDSKLNDVASKIMKNLSRVKVEG